MSASSNVGCEIGERRVWRRGNQPPVLSSRTALRAAGEGAVHSVGIEATGAGPSGVDDGEHLRSGAGNAQSVLVNVVGVLLCRRNVKRIHCWAGYIVLDASEPDRSRVLCLGGQNCASRGQVGLAADERSGAEIGAYADILELPRELQEAVDARISVTESVEVDSRLQHRGRT